MLSDFFMNFSKSLCSFSPDCLQRSVKIITFVAQHILSKWQMRKF